MNGKKGLEMGEARLILPQITAQRLSAVDHSVSVHRTPSVIVSFHGTGIIAHNQQSAPTGNGVMA